MKYTNSTEAAQCKAYFCGRSLAEIVGSNPAQGHGCLSVVSVVCCQVEVFASGLSLVQRRPTDFGREAWVMRRSWRTGGCCATGGAGQQSYGGDYFLIP